MHVLPADVKIGNLLRNDVGINNNLANFCKRREGLGHSPFVNVRCIVVGLLKGDL